MYQSDSDSDDETTVLDLPDPLPRYCETEVTLQANKPLTIFLESSEHTDMERLAEIIDEDDLPFIIVKQSPSPFMITIQHDKSIYKYELNPVEYDTCYYFDVECADGTTWKDFDIDVAEKGYNRVTVAYKGDLEDIKVKISLCNIPESTEDYTEKIFNLTRQMYIATGMPGEGEETEEQPSLKQVYKMLQDIYYMPGMPGSAIPWKSIQEERFKKLLE